ncbi:MAG TPA: STAS domain-containing protein [Candidatus Baltobacteraceae bacterium]|jgi:anti-anti-sigma factor
MNPPRTPFSVAHHTEASQHLVEVVGDIDIFTTPDFSAALQQVHDAPRVILDLSRCEYIDSTGISVLFRLQQSTQGKLRLVVGHQDKIRRILEVTRVDKVIEIFPSVEAAKV